MGLYNADFIAFLKTSDRVQDLLDAVDRPSIMAYIEKHQLFSDLSPQQMDIPILKHLARACTECSDFAQSHLEHDCYRLLMESRFFSTGKSKILYPSAYGTGTTEDMHTAFVSDTLDLCLTHWSTFYRALLDCSATDARVARIDRWLDIFFLQTWFLDASSCDRLCLHIMNDVLEHAAQHAAADPEIMRFVQKMINAAHVGSASGMDSEKAWSCCQLYRDATSCPPPIFMLAAARLPQAHEQLARWFTQEAHRVDIYEMFERYVQNESAKNGLFDFFSSLDQHFYAEHVESLVPLHLRIEYQLQRGTLHWNIPSSHVEEQGTFRLYTNIPCGYDFSWARSMLPRFDHTQKIDFIRNMGPILEYSRKNYDFNGKFDYVPFYRAVFEDPDSSVQLHGLLLLLHRSNTENDVQVLQRVCSDYQIRQIGTRALPTPPNRDNLALYLIEHLFPQHIDVVRGMYVGGLCSIEDQLLRCCSEQSYTAALEIDTFLS